MPKNMTENEKQVSRRDFVKSATALSAGALAAGAGPLAYAGGSDTIRIGLIGCGGRGTLDARNCIEAAPGIQLYAMGDLFRKRRGRSRRMGVEDAYSWLKPRVRDHMNVPEERRFVGWNAYKKVLQTDVDLVLLTTPGHFRPQQFEAAVEAGKHVFIEKPIAVDPPGVRRVIKTARKAREKGLSVVAGTQRRHHLGKRAVMEKIHQGALGELLAAQCYTCYGSWMPTSWTNERLEGMSDLEWQIRNQYYFTWMSGDQIVEQHVHMLDLINWAFGGPPERCLGTGGRQVRTAEKYGNVFDHFAVEYEYPNGARLTAICRQMDGSSDRHGVNIIGTKGTSDSNVIRGENPYRYEGEVPDPDVQEHVQMIRGIRQGEPLHEGVRVAKSTLTAIMGRMSAYTGHELSWKWAKNESKLDLGPDEYEFGPYEANPVAMPGKTELV